MKKILLSLLFTVAVLTLRAQVDSTTFNIALDSNKSIELNGLWKFHDGDDSLWASKEYDDTKWQNIKSNFGIQDSSLFNGIGWFRLHIKIDSALTLSSASFSIYHYGASEIYVDGKFISSFGKVSKDPSKEKRYNPHTCALPMGTISPGIHTIAMRYSNADYRRLSNQYDANNIGFTITLYKSYNAFKQNEKNSFGLNAIGIALSFSFFTLCFIHLLIFLFYRKYVSNFYYSIFVALLGSLFFIPILIDNTTDSEFSVKYFYYYILYVLPIFFYSMLLLEYSIFNEKFWYRLLIATALILGIGTTLTLLFGQDAPGYYFSFSVDIGAFCTSLSVVITAIIRKKEGAWIIGTGSLLFLLLLGIILFSLLFSRNVNFNISSGETSGLVLSILILLAITSIPISMSVFLARQFAQTNKNLEKELQHVEELSNKTIEQEKERQKLLESQNELLETQVKERTSEIISQKNIIEEKNKSITDSINYAQTIQKAILPAQEYVNRIFPESFVLFKPKDIVSGDFYWLTEKNEKKIIAVCDCTGHGVPGSMMSMIGNNLLNHIVNEKGITTPNEILNHLHKDIRKTLRQEEQSEARDGMDISILCFNADKSIEFAGAQRPLWIVEKTTDSNEKPFQLIEIKGNKFAIGGIQLEMERSFTNHNVAIKGQSTLYIFSDGYADQFSDKDSKLMSSRFKEMLLNMQRLSMLEQQKYLDTFIENWKGTREQIDDILVIGVKIV